MLYTATTREQSASDAATRALASASERTSENQRDDRSRPMPAMPHESRMNRIARRAHEIYEARGGEHGTELGDWLQAEREVDAEIDASREAEG